MTGSEHFDQAAGTWDQEARRVALAQAVAQAIRDRVPLDATLDALDFGCGTGLVTLAVAPYVGSMTGADASPGMLRVLQDKAQGLPVRLLEGEDGDLGGPYHLILSSMTLHHVEDVPALLKRFYAALRPGGRVALADLDAEDGSFHGEASGVFHYGFRRERMEAWLFEAGFVDVALETATVTRKEDRDYSVFLATGKKP